MPKVETIITDSQKKVPSRIPELSQILESDCDRLIEALKFKSNDLNYYALLRIVLSECNKKIKPKDTLKPLLDINFNQLSGDILLEARIRVCETIIEVEDLFRTSVIEKHLADLGKSTINDPIHRAKIELIRAGNECLKGDYLRAAHFYLSASREEAFVKDELRKINLINQAIALVFISPINSDSHKLICTLCLNEFAKKSHLIFIVNKLYTQDIISADEISKVEAILPEFLRAGDQQGISRVSQAKFSHNMIPITNSFSCISFRSLVELIGINIDELLLLLEKTYEGNQMKIDQMKQYIYFVKDETSSNLVKDFLSKIDDIISN